MARSEISFLDPLDARGAAFVESIQQANTYHLLFWVNIIAECYGYRSFIIALIDENETICAGLPGLEVGSTLTGRRWTSLPFTNYCQPLYHGRNAFKSLTSESGFKIFDFGRSDFKNEGLRPYKNRWGTDETLLTYSLVSDLSSHLSSGRMVPFMHKIIRRKK